MDKYAMDNENNSSENNNESGNTFQGENKKQGAEKSGGCGCGCKAHPADDEVVEIEEEDFEY